MNILAPMQFISVRGRAINCARIAKICCFIPIDSIISPMFEVCHSNKPCSLKYYSAIAASPSYKKHSLNRPSPPWNNCLTFTIHINW